MDRDSEDLERKGGDDFDASDDSGSRKSKRGGGGYAVHFIVITAIFLGVAGGLFLVFKNVGSNFSSKSVEVPDVKGMRVREAKSRARSSDLSLSVKKEIFSPKPAGVIVEQDPPAGALVKSGRIVCVVVSKGKETAEIPDLSGLSAREAVSILNSLGISNVRTEFKSHSGPPGVVVDQNPAAGSSAPLDCSVLLSVSRASLESEDGMMPDLRGKTEREAAAALLALDLGFERVQSKSTDFPEGVVIAQDVEPGSAVRAGTVVRLTVNSSKSDEARKAEGKDGGSAGDGQQGFDDDPSRGPGVSDKGVGGGGDSASALQSFLNGGEDSTFVPVLVGKPVSEAKSLVENAGMRIGEIRFEDPNSASAVIVSSQSLEPGIWVKRGTSVDLVLSDPVNEMEQVLPDPDGTLQGEVKGAAGSGDANNESGGSGKYGVAPGTGYVRNSSRPSYVRKSAKPGFVGKSARPGDSSGSGDYAVDGGGKNSENGL